MGSNNILLHLRHHHPALHAKIVEKLDRGQGSSKSKIDSNIATSPGDATVVIKSEPDQEQVQVKVELSEENQN